MSLMGSNVADLHLNQILTNFRFPKAPFTLRRFSLISRSSSSSQPHFNFSASDGAAGSPKSENHSTVDSVSFVERLLCGSLNEDGTSYKYNFRVRGYEVGINKTATIETIAYHLQEAGLNHAQSLGYSREGFGTTNVMRKLNLLWVMSHMHIEMHKYPGWGDMVEIETWCQREGRISLRRDWILKDFATSTVIGRATCKSVMINQETRRVQKLTDEMLNENMIFCPPTPRFAFSDDSSHLKKIPKLEDPAKYSKIGLMPRRVDLDMNQHVNNVTYIIWILESIPQEIVDTHELQKITLDYRRECQLNELIDSFTNIELKSEEALLDDQGTNGSASVRKHEQDCCQFLHFLRLSNGLVISRGRTVWRRKLSR